MTGVSFVVTIYNKAAYLDGVLSALARQVGDFEREFIFVDDGSTDGSLEILRAHTADWRNVTIVAQANAGPSIASNAGFARARLPFLKPVDGDDRLAPEATLLLLDALDRASADVAYGRQGEYDPSRGYRDTLEPHPEAAVETATKQAPSPVADALALAVSSVPFNPSQMLVRTALVQRVGGCDEGVFAQDYSLALRLATVARFVRCDRTVSLVPRTLGTRLSGNKAQMLHDANLALARFLEQHPDLPPRYRRKAFRRAAGRALKWARRHQARPVLSRELLAYWRGLLGLSRDPAADVHGTCRTFRAGGQIRDMPGAAPRFGPAAVGGRA
jgi:glycosyltransferase involved in cell wall biosynthesis